MTPTDQCRFCGDIYPLVELQDHEAHCTGESREDFPSGYDVDPSIEEENNGKNR